MRPLPWVVAGLGHVYCIHCLLAISNKYPFSGGSEQRAVISDHNLKHLRMIIQSRGSACSGRTVASDSPSPIGFQSNAERLQASPLQRARSIGQAMPSCERSLLPVP